MKEGGKLESFATCLHRTGEKCILNNRNCTRDYNQEHHPNNLDCANHTPIRTYSFYVYPSVREATPKIEPVAVENG